MKTLLIYSLFLVYNSAIAQTFDGLWKGTITRDYGNEVVTDTIELDLQQQGTKITGYSLWYKANGIYIRSVLEGFYNDQNKTLRLTETSIDFQNIPDRGELVFLDQYLLTFDVKDKLVLTGKSVSRERKPIYSRSKMRVRKI
ncbi:MAG: hypothetical protein V4717_17165 [Bacteroidota bacterium]